MKQLKYDSCEIYPVCFFTLIGKHLSEFSINKTCSVYNKNEIIFSEGNPPAGLFWISKGKVKIEKEGREGRKQVVRFAKEGDILGYRALLSGENYSASAISMEKSRICFIGVDIFFKLLKQDQGFSLNIIRQLAVDLRNAEFNLTEMAQKPVRERTAEVLLMLEEFFGVKEDGKTINMSLSREDIANIIGTATESLIRFLSEFKQIKIIELDNKEIKILNRKQLLKIANLSDNLAVKTPK